jgi:dolichyl-phosphate beta-glucosyltransferase
VGPTISLVIPAYNEKGRIAASLRQVVAYSTSRAAPCEIVLVVEKSTDGTLDLGRELLRDVPGAVVIDNQEQRGKGHAVRTGMLRASGELVFFMDLDLSTPLCEIDMFVARAQEFPSVDIWIGNRRHALTEIVRRQTLVRQSMGRTFNWLVRRLALGDLLDTQCGFKLFRRHTVAPVFERQTLDGFSFDVEVLLIAQRLGFEIRDLPVQWENSPESKVRLVRDSARMFMDLLLVRRRVDRAFRASPRL